MGSYLNIFFISSDINECDPAKPLSRCIQMCLNTPGGYTCSCENGFKLSKDGYDCEGICWFIMALFNLFDWQFVSKITSKPKTLCKSNNAFKFTCSLALETRIGHSTRLFCFVYLGMFLVSLLIFEFSFTLQQKA